MSKDEVDDSNREGNCPGLRVKTAYCLSMTIAAEVSGMRDPGTLAIMLTGKVDVLCRVRTCPAVTAIITLPAGDLVNSSGKRVKAEKQEPGIGVPSK